MDAGDQHRAQRLSPQSGPPDPPAAEELSEETKANAAEGVVAYSAACSMRPARSRCGRRTSRPLYCACHGSEFDPQGRRPVVGGPATRRLAMLPLQIEGGELLAAGPFTGPVGAQKR